MIKLYRVSGDSLYPLLKSGDLVLGIRFQPYFKIKQHDIVTFSYKEVGVMIKQVRFVQNNKVFVEGTTPDSLDSRVFGTIPLQNILHKVLFKIPFI